MITFEINSAGASGASCLLKSGGSWFLKSAPSCHVKHNLSGVNRSSFYCVSKIHILSQCQIMK